MDEAVNAAYEAQKKVADMSLEERGRMVDIIRRICMDRREELGRMEMEETKVGRLDHKILKLTNMRFVLGVEAMRSDARSDQTGLCIIERAPWGVIGMMLPVTHSVPTMASNAINILAAGNTAVFGPHPSGARVAQYALQLLNREIERELRRCQRRSPRCAKPASKLPSRSSIIPKLRCYASRAARAVAKAAAKSGKRVIAGGPGNPPVVVDETADLDRAAKCIIEGAAFDNNLLCIGEKEIFVVASVADAFIRPCAAPALSNWIRPPLNGLPRPLLRSRAAAADAHGRTSKRTSSARTSQCWQLLPVSALPRAPSSFLARRMKTTPSLLKSR